MKHQLVIRRGTFLAEVVALVLATIVDAAVARADGFKPGDFPGPPASVDDYNETILQLALADEVNFTDRVLRMHYAAMPPGGMILQHSHANRPTIEYILNGTATETKKG